MSAQVYGSDFCPRLPLTACPSSAVLHGRVVINCPILVAQKQGSFCQCDLARQQTKGTGHSQESILDSRSPVWPYLTAACQLQSWLLSEHCALPLIPTLPRGCSRDCKFIGLPGQGGQVSDVLNKGQQDSDQQYIALRQQHSELQQQHILLRQQHITLWQQHVELWQQHIALQQQHAVLQQLEQRYQSPTC